MALDKLVDLLAVADRWVGSGCLSNKRDSIYSVCMVYMFLFSRYETPTLRALCEKLLVSRVEDSNVFSLLEVAEHYSLHQLTVCILMYPSSCADN